MIRVQKGEFTVLVGAIKVESKSSLPKLKEGAKLTVY